MLGLVGRAGLPDEPALRTVNFWSARRAEVEGRGVGNRGNRSTANAGTVTVRRMELSVRKFSLRPRRIIGRWYLPERT
jgi:hypothetical protein